MRVAAIVVAAGRGERLGQELPKAYVRVAKGHMKYALCMNS
jgi:2-C-methyl-D-erythritol 4-phosphate cytidylyltransferase